MHSKDWIPEGQRHLSKDALLADLIVRHAAVPLVAQTRVDLFSSLAHAIVNQQLSGRVAEVIFQRLRGLFPRKRLTAAGLLKIPRARLRRAGLSWNKIKSLRDLAQRTIAGTLPTARELRTLPDEILMERLTEVHGIGPWTVQMLLIFKLGRPDVFPANDLGVQKGFQKLMKRRSLPSAKQLAKHGLRWKPYRTLAAWYLWRAVDEMVVRPAADERMWTAG